MPGILIKGQPEQNGDRATFSVLKSRSEKDYNLERFEHQNTSGDLYPIKSYS